MPFRLCVQCGRKWQTSALYTNICRACRDAQVAPTLDLLREIGHMHPLEAYVRGILAEKVRAHDRESIRELGAVLDRLRQPVS